MSKTEIKEINVSLVDPPAEPDRIEINSDEIKALSESIKQVGLLQPILVTPRGDRFEVVAGDRRYKALKLNGVEKIPCIVREMSQDEVYILRATENIARENLSGLEEAIIYKRLNETCGMTWDQIGEKFGKSAHVVKRRTDILRMPQEIQEAIHKKDISIGVGEELWKIPDITALNYYLSFAVENGVTVSIARQWVRDYERELRTKSNDVNPGGSFRHPSEKIPVYVACDLCRSAMEIGTESVIRMCPNCADIISKVIKESNQ